MDPDFWQGRWKEGRIGFHEGRPNAHLEMHVALLGEAKRVLVPLCGKTEDMAFLAARGHHVVGVELVESAARAFFEEHQLTPHVQNVGPFVQYQSQSVSILVGDFFQTTLEWLGPVNALYDRAALIALPEALRAAYVKHLRLLLPQGSPGLLVTLEYPQQLMEGPPFSVSKNEVSQHFAGMDCKLLAECAAEGPRFTEIGARECCWALQF